MTPEAQGRAIAEARRAGRKLSAYPGTRPASLADAYVVQEAMVDALGGRRVGWKVGCTSALAREALGVDAPIYGPVMAETLHESPGEVVAGETGLGIAEAEIALRLGADLREMSVTLDALQGAIEMVHPVIEHVGKRLPGGPKDDAEWCVADGGYHAALILGAGVAYDPQMDLVSETVRVAYDGEEVATGSGAAVDTGPLGVALWLAQSLGARGIALQAGDIISTGLMTPVVPISAGRTMTARFATLGDVTLTLT